MPTGTPGAWGPFGTPPIRRQSQRGEPAAHHTSHENGGSDEVALDWSQLASGVPSTFAPSGHNASHENGGSDEIEIADLGTAEMDTSLVLAPDGAGGAGWRAETGGGGGYPYLCYQDQKAQNTNSGNITAGAWRTHDLNTEVADTAGLGSVASNQVTLAAGTYEFEAVTCTYQQANAQIRLQDITNAATLGLGPMTRDGAGTGEPGANPFVRGRFTIAGSTVIELQQRCSHTTTTGQGYGVQGNWGVEVYATLHLWKVA